VFLYKAIFQSLLNLRFSDEMQPNYVTNVGDGQLFGGLAVCLSNRTAWFPILTARQILLNSCHLKRWSHICLNS